MSKVYYVRYLKPGESGLGALLGCFSSSTSDEYKKDNPTWFKDVNPELFVDKGTYSLMISTDEQISVAK